MGWNPSINFKLRDDEIVFGDLIMDKNTAELLGEALMNIKEGRPVENLSEVLEYVYTNDEFIELKDTFREVKEDIKYFSEVLAGMGRFIPGVSSMVGRTKSTFDYVVGTTSWIEKYKNYVTIAAEAYSQLCALEYQFPPEKSGEYAQRYGDVLTHTTEKERIRESIEIQFQEDIKEIGLEAAIKRKIENEFKCGINSEGTTAMLNSLTVSMGQSKQEGIEEANALRDATDEARNKMVKDVQELYEDSNLTVDLNSDLVLKTWKEIKDVVGIDRSRLSNAAFRVLSILKREYKVLIEDPICVEEYESSDVISEDLMNRVIRSMEMLIRDLGVSSGRAVFDVYTVKVNMNEWTTMLTDIASNKPYSNVSEPSPA